MVGGGGSGRKRDSSDMVRLLTRCALYADTKKAPRRTESTGVYFMLLNGKIGAVTSDGYLPRAE